MKTLLSTLIVVLSGALSVHAQQSNSTTIPTRICPPNATVPVTTDAVRVQPGITSSHDSDEIIIACDFGLARRNKIRQQREAAIVKSRNIDTTSSPLYTLIKCKTEVPAVKTIYKK